MRDGTRLASVVIGAATTLILGVIVLYFGLDVPFVAVVGGVVAGYLGGGDRVDGGKVGAYSALLAFVPAVVVYLSFAKGLLIGMQYGGYWGEASLFALVFITVYAVGLLGVVTASGIVGGMAGSYLQSTT